MASCQQDVPMPCNLKAALVPTAGAHCNIND
jgi:hypothetical protein